MCVCVCVRVCVCVCTDVDREVEVMGGVCGELHVLRDGEASSLQSSHSRSMQGEILGEKRRKKTHHTPNVKMRNFTALC